MSKLSRGSNNVIREYIDSIKPFCNSRGDAKVIRLFDFLLDWLFQDYSQRAAVSYAWSLIGCNYLFHLFLSRDLYIG